MEPMDDGRRLARYSPILTPGCSRSCRSVDGVGIPARDFENGARGARRMAGKRPSSTEGWAEPLRVIVIRSALLRWVRKAGRGGVDRICAVSAERGSPRAGRAIECRREDKRRWTRRAYPHDIDEQVAQSGDVELSLGVEMADRAVVRRFPVPVGLGRNVSLVRREGRRAVTEAGQCVERRAANRDNSIECQDRCQQDPASSPPHATDGLKSGLRGALKCRRLPGDGY
jgi:hypothetical protein